MSPSQSKPSQRRSSIIFETTPSLTRGVSRSSTRRITRPPWARAESQAHRKVRTFPTWREPVGLGASRPTTVIEAQEEEQGPDEKGSDRDRSPGRTRPSRVRSSYQMSKTVQEEPFCADGPELS